MKKQFAILCAFVSLTSLATPRKIIITSHIVGSEGYCISQGVSRVTVRFEGLHAFPTLGDVIRFDEPSAIIGDILSFQIDGRQEDYRVTQYNGTNSSMVLTGKRQTPPISFNGIELPSSFTIQHFQSNAVYVTSAGTPTLNHSQDRESPSPPSIQVDYISPLDNKPRSISARR